MDEEGSTKRVTCTILAIDHRDMFYSVCAVCERTISNPSFVCHSSNPPSKRLFRILMSVATDTQVLTVICFDRVARLLFGCSADEFFHFAKLHPFSGVTVNEILEGEMFTMTLSKPMNPDAQHMRVASADPFSSSFRPAIHLLKQCYGSPTT
ncbi:Alpha-L-fucosidase 1 [Spatholobus suberectus]|nr:Alpha-L-fucosidase 1 [Spatholobus suberectus]